MNATEACTTTLTHSRAYDQASKPLSQEAKEAIEAESIDEIRGIVAKNRVSDEYEDIS